MRQVNPNASAESVDSPSLDDVDRLTFDELMRSSYDEFGISGSPLVFPALLRRVVAKLVSLDACLFALVVWLLHRVWGFFGRWHSNPLARSWSELASQLSWTESQRLAKAFADLDQHPTFIEGTRELGFRNSLEAAFYRSSFLDPFFAQGRWEITDTTHPLQQPQYFVCGIPARRTYDPQQFAWAAMVEGCFEAVKAELLEILSKDLDRFKAFHTEIDATVDGWNTFILYANGKRQEDNCRRAPRLAEISDAMIAHEKGELTMLSALGAGRHIPPHVGPLNGILRCHLPLVVPDACALRVGGQVIHWKEGKVLVFDDSFVHEVWNKSDQRRIVLFFNAWHPVLSDAERTALDELRRAYNDTPAGRNWIQLNERARDLAPAAGDG